jgi:GxxExxY protein
LEKLLDLPQRHEGHKDLMKYAPISEDIETIANKVFNCGLKVHRELGAGLLESIYEVCLAHEINKIGLKVERQVQLPIIYDGITFDAGMRLDLLIEDKLIIEVKAVESLLPVHHAQLMTYLKLTKNRLGLLINFNIHLFKNGTKRVIL